MKLLLLIAVFITALNPWQEILAAEKVKDPLYGQVFFGQLNLSDNTVEFETDDETVLGEIPDSIPYFGAAAQNAWHDGVFGYGWEGGGFFSWKNDSVYYHVSTGGEGTTVRVAVDNQYWSFETFFGLFAAFKPHERIRFYASGGPLFMFASTKAKSVEEPPEVSPASGSSIEIDLNQYHTDFTMGGYVRAGFDIQLEDNFWVGFSARHMKASLDIPKSLGKFDIDGDVYFLTITKKM